MLITTLLTQWGGYWKSSKPLKWRSHGYCSFFAYHPFSSSHSTLLSAANPNPNPSFSPPSLLLTYSVPSDIAQQVDLLSAKSSPYLSSAQQIVSLGFNHALTAIQFKTGSQLPSGITIKSISFKNIPYKGIHKLGETGNNAWTIDQAHKRDFTLTLNYSSDGTTGKDITTPDNTFFLLPQVLPDEAAVEVTMMINGQLKTLKKAINGKTWKQGEKIVYNLSSSKITQETFTLEAVATGSANYDGTGNITYNIKSTKTDGFGHVSFAPWTMEFSTDGGSTWKAEKPDFITLTTQENNGYTYGKYYNATFAPQTKTVISSHDILAKRTVLNDVDLAHRDIHGNLHHNGQSTANCYVIHNPGTYKFPTVYGNSIKNGATNTAAYTSTKNGANILKNFLRADGNAIDKPEIDGIANACLIWQDSDKLISDIKYDAASKYVSFEVKQATIHNGNAIIAVRDNYNTILWSWHIWVTEEDLTPVEITNQQKVNYNILPINLGWCGLGNSTEYAQREVKVRIKQTEGNKTADLTLNQTGNLIESDRTNGNCTFYQWGRKDPMLPSNGKGNTDKSCYPGESQYQFAYKGHGSGLNTTEIKDYIKHPHKFNTKSVMDYKYNNLWNVDNEKTDVNDDKVIKSVYDPCPVGYTVAPVRTFTGFTTTGSNSSTTSEWNVQGGFNKGWLFYGKSNKSGSTVFFPAAGRRNPGTGSLSSVSTVGSYWVAGPNGTNSGRLLYFNTSDVGPLNYGSRSCGFAVRPAVEE